MALVDGAPSIRLEGDKKRALALIPEGRLLLSKAQGVAERAGVPTYSMNRRVSDDEYIYVLVAGGQNIIQISAGVVVPDRVEELLEPGEGTLFPNFLSGNVYDGRMIERSVTNADGSVTRFKTVRSFAPTPTAARICKTPTGRHGNGRLAVVPQPEMGWDAPPSTTTVYSQYQVPRSSMWSGTMKKVVQIVFGMGRINPNMLRDPDKPNEVTAFMKEVKTVGVQVEYDYKFMRTHGIYRGDDNVLWLVEISATRGVLAMPLPIFPGSDKPAFLLQARNRNDGAMVRALEELKCLPTGETFPKTSEQLEKKIANGDILRLKTAAELEPFYRLSGYSSVCGWAFSDKGNEAHNVGYYYPESENFQKGMWYQLNISIGNVNLDRKPKDPIASGSASLVKQHEGYLYSPPNRKPSVIPVKYFEPLMEPPGLLSHGAAPKFGVGVLDKDCDTVVFVAFINGALKTARFFRAGLAQTVDTSFDDRIGEPCLLSGSWSFGSESGLRAVPEMPYTNDIDRRGLLTANVMNGTMTAFPVGYSAARGVVVIDRPQYVVVLRSRIFEQQFSVEYKVGETRQACFVAPAMSREAYYMFEGRKFSAHHGSTGTALASATDPNQGISWSLGPGGLPGGPPIGPQCSGEVCGGKNVDPRIMCTFFNNTEACKDYSDSGEWLTRCGPSFSFSGSGSIRPGTSSMWDRGNDFQGTWNLVMHGVNGIESGTINESEYDYAMRASPDPISGTQNIHAESSGIGEDCAIYRRGFFGAYVANGYTAGPINLQNDFMPAFIGVNQP